MLERKLEGMVSKLLLRLTVFNRLHALLSPKLTSGLFRKQCKWYHGSTGTVLSGLTNMVLGALKLYDRSCTTEYLLHVKKWGASIN